MTPTKDHRRRDEPREVRAHIQTRRGDFHLDLSLRVEQGTTVALLGPNGSGKSTVVSALAGLVPLESGEIVVSGEVWERPATGIRLPPQKRSIGVMFQGLLLFPALSAIDNVAYGLTAAGETRRSARLRAHELMERFDIAGLAEHRPNQLSGGQAQRVALARALATEPKVLLLDEPMSALDVAVRAEARRTLKETLAAFTGAAVVVTHDPLEAMSLAEALVILENGSVSQEGTPGEITRRPRSSYVASLAGTNFLEGSIVSAGGHWSFESGGGRLSVSPEAAGEEGPALAVVHPRAVTLLTEEASAATSARNVLEGKIVAVEVLGDRARIALATTPGLVAEVTLESVEALALEEGRTAWASIKSTQIDVYTE